MELSNKEARHLILTNQGLADNFFGNKKNNTFLAQQGREFPPQKSTPNSNLQLFGEN